jgi:spore coat protein U-like protein
MMRSPIPRHSLLLSTMLLLSLGAHAECSVSTSGLEFGGYSPFDTQHTEATATITVDCSEPYTLVLDQGQQGSYSPRGMAHDSVAGATLEYNLYTGPGFSIVWGNGTGGTQTVSADGSGVPMHHDIHGRIPAGQVAARVGSYRDTVIVTLEF